MQSEVKKTLFHELLAFFLGLIMITTLLTTGCTAFTPKATATQIMEKPDISKNIAIHYTVTYQDNIREVFQARGGQTYLILDMDIQNNMISAIKKIDEIISQRRIDKIPYVLLINGINYSLIDNNKKVRLKDGDIFTVIPIVSGG